MSTKRKWSATPTKLKENFLILQQVKQDDDDKLQDEINAEQTWDLTPA